MRSVFYKCVCVHVSACACVCVCMHVCVQCAYMCMHGCGCVGVWVCACACVYVCVHMCVCIGVTEAASVGVWEGAIHVLLSDLLFIKLAFGPNTF